jgi:hypothetical protein
VPKYVVVCELYRGARTDYRALRDALASLRAVQVTETSWYVATRLQAETLGLRLRELMAEADVLAVDELTPGRGGHSSWGTPPEALAWKDRNLGRPPAGR